MFHNIYSMQSKETLMKENRELFWDISDVSELDDRAIEERFLKYGNWKNIQDMLQIFWLEKLRADYIKIRDQKRNDLSEKTIHFFNLYFHV